MISKILSAIPLGFDGQIIHVEGDMNRGLPGLFIVGLANKTITESKERVRSAIINSGFIFPANKITINLAPAELPKTGPHLDLPIALSILTLSQQLLTSDTNQKLFVGELSLDGRLRPIRGIINIVEAAKSLGVTQVFVPFDNLAQASLIPGVQVFGARDLRSLVLHLRGVQSLPLSPAVVKNNKTEENPLLLDHIYGQAIAKRALTIALAGRHNLLLSGPPGSGKTLLAKTAISLLPPLTAQEQIDITKIHGLNGSGDIITKRPFRAPHHSASLPSLIGGGAQSTPGEISLSHLGILFLDELPEYPRAVIESLRQPLEDHQITISRVNFRTTYPANFLLIATMNPCPCGYLGDPHRECTCSPGQITRYQQKLSGPLLDRIDLQVTVPKIPTAELSQISQPNNSLKTSGASLISHNSQHQATCTKIATAIKRQTKRYQSPLVTNGSISSQQATTLPISPPAKELLLQASNKLALSTRSYFKILKVAQTIADLNDSPLIDLPELSEALSYRF